MRCDRLWVAIILAASALAAVAFGRYFRLRKTVASAKTANQLGAYSTVGRVVGGITSTDEVRFARIGELAPTIERGL